MAVIIIIIVGWIAVYLISKRTGETAAQDKAEFMLTSGLGFKGCGIVLLILIVAAVGGFVYLLSLFE